MGIWQSRVNALCLLLYFHIEKRAEDISPKHHYFGASPVDFSRIIVDLIPYSFSLGSPVENRKASSEKSLFMSRQKNGRTRD